MLADRDQRADLTPIGACQVCTAELPPPVLDLGALPLCDALLPIGSSETVPRYPVQISLCPRCLTGNQRFHVRKEVLFPPEYHYRPRFTGDVLTGMADLVEEYRQAWGEPRGRLVWDIGCSDGSLLDMFAAAGARTAGIEPTDAAQEAAERGHTVRQEYFDRASAGALLEQTGIPDLITFTNVFAHIESLDEAIEAIRVAAGPATVVIVENHYLGSVLRTRQFDTFYHEHPRTYGVRSFEHIAGRLGARIAAVTFPSRYGGNVRVTMTGIGAGAEPGRPPESAAVDESWFAAEFEELAAFVPRWVEEARPQLDDAAAGGLLGKSFPGRAAILHALLGVDETMQPVVYEKPGSLKIGHYVPGTRVEILSDEDWIDGHHPPALLVWAWHIADEIARYLRGAGFRGRLYTVLPEFRELA